MVETLSFLTVLSTGLSFKENLFVIFVLWPGLAKAMGSCPRLSPGAVLTPRRAKRAGCSTGKDSHRDGLEQDIAQRDGARMLGSIPVHRYPPGGPHVTELSREDNFGAQVIPGG